MEPNNLFSTQFPALPELVSRNLRKEDRPLLRELLDRVPYGAPQLTRLLRELVAESLVQPASGLTTKHKRLLMLVSLAYVADPQTCVAEVLAKEIAIGHWQDPEGPSDTYWLREIALEWLGGIARLLRCRPLPLIRDAWLLAIGEPQDPIRTALLDAVLGPQDPQALITALEAMPPLHEGHSPKWRALWIRALFISHLPAFNATMALSALAQASRRAGPDRGRSVMIIQFEAHELLHQMIGLAISQPSPGIDDWWLAVELLAFDYRARVDGHMQQFAQVCQQNKAVFWYGCPCLRWVAAGVEWARLVSHRSPVQRTARSIALCAELQDLLLGDVRGAQPAWPSNEFLRVWAVQLGLLANDDLEPAGRIRIRQLAQAIQGQIA